MTDRPDKLAADHVIVTIPSLNVRPSPLLDKIPDTAEGRRLWASLTDEQRAAYRPSVADERPPTDLAAIRPGAGRYSIWESWKPIGAQRTVLPGGIMLGTTIPAQPDPSKIVGVFHAEVCSCGRSRGSGVHAEGAVNGHPFEARSEPSLPPIPPAGFYWAKCNVKGPDDWTVVEVTTTYDFHGRQVPHVACLDYEAGCEVTEWGPALSPPGTGVALDETTGKCTGCAVPIHRGNSVSHVGDRRWHTQCLVRSLTGEVEVLQRRYDERKAQRLTYVEAQEILRALVATVATGLTGRDLERLAAAIARGTIQPAECRHDGWHSPMPRCPGCGTEGR